jgi:hypothetical protein
MTLAKTRILPTLVVFAAAFISACGSDSIGPGSIDSNAALQSLTLALQSTGSVGSPTSPDVSTSLGGVAPLLDRVSVTIDGASQGMFALGLRETFPVGTCEEDVFIDPLMPPPSGVCTLPPLGVVLILWQSHSATQPPDRMIFIVTEAGTTNFDFSATSVGGLPAVALYIEGQENIWGSLSGNLTSQVSATSQTCNVPLPPYAKSATCSIATFDEQGSIVFEPFSIDAPSTQRKTIAIPPQTLHGLWLAITEVQAVPLTMNRMTTGILGMRLKRLQPIPAR